MYDLTYKRLSYSHVPPPPCADVGSGAGSAATSGPPAPAPSAPSSTMGTPRSIELMVKARREIQRKLPDLLPSGPWLSDEAALVDIRAWAENPKLGGGGWGVSWGSGKRAGTKDRGQQHVVVCHQHKRNCGWRLTLEHCEAHQVVTTCNAAAKLFATVAGSRDTGGTAACAAAGTRPARAFCHR